MGDAGLCVIKPEFILPEKPRELLLECISDSDKTLIRNESDSNLEESPNKKRKLSKKLKGQNKARGPTFRREHERELCSSLILLKKNEAIPECTRKNCKFLHDIDEYMSTKPEDIGSRCYNFETNGFCSRGLTCRFGGSHIVNNRNVVDESKYGLFILQGSTTCNQLQHELQVALRKHTYDFSLPEKIIKFNDAVRKQKEQTETPTATSGAITDEDIIRLLQREKKSITWKDKLLLSPLTTVGNLPFRRICKEYGADITCGEMAMCSSLLQGNPQEWALVKRHRTEDIFGVQLCANNPHLFAKCAQLLENETNVDFVDINLGCPIELVYKQGGGCGLLRRERTLEMCVRSVSQVLSCPLTVKTRTGVYSNENIAHKLIPKFKEWGASLVTVHGRSKEQRYTRQADWSYINQCTLTVDTFPVIGNGDILSYEDYKQARETSPKLTTVMIGRGALIKPWLFTEIKEKKVWDISSSERFEIIKKYVNYGLEHWGSDTKGVENTRRFLLEWLSFLYRYVPVGLLETPPQKINERPPFYKGRDDMETLMASPAASDWIKISEMLLGKVPDGFHFLPKHKANSYK